MSFSLSSLLYYNLSEKKHKDLKKGLIEYQVLLTALIESLESLEKGDLEKFDSLVGENACQIRAIRIAMIHESYSHHHELRQKALKAHQTISKILEEEIEKWMLSSISLEDLLSKYALEVVLTADEFFLIKSFLLTEMKEVLSSDTFMSSLIRKSKCSPVKVRRFNSQVSYSFTSHLASHIRQLLAKASVEFVQELARQLEDEDLLEKVSGDFLFEHNALSCLPMFWTYKILLESSEKKQIPIIAHVKFLKEQEEGYLVTHEEKYFFKPTQNPDGTFSYAATSFLESDLEKAACIIQGVACTDTSWDKETFLSSIKQAVLAGAADHRQYPNPDQPLPTSCKELQSYQKLALDKGFTFENPKTFVIQHVYSARADRVLS
jgi:hypothetical protein